MENLLQKDDVLFLEASTSTFEFCDRIKGKVKEVIVVDPFQFKRNMKQGKKTDKIDAKKLAEAGRYHIETGGDFLPVVYIPDKDIRKLRSLFSTYNLLLKEINTTRNRIHSLFRQNLSKWRGREEKEELEKDLERSGMEEEYKVQVRRFFEILKVLMKEKEETKREILIIGQKYKEDIDLLTSISGVSVFIAIAMISDYITVERFKDSRSFCKYLRSTPRTEESNKKRKNGKTERQGRKLSIKMILQGISHIKRGSYGLNKFYTNLRKGKGACKARVALARKVFTIIYYILRDRKYYFHMKEALHKKKMMEYENFLKANNKI